MTRWFRMYTDVLDDPKVQKLPPEEFKRQFLDALAGAENAFTKWVRVCNGRLSPSVWRRLAQKVFRRDGFCCRYCGEKSEKLECDHVHPVSRGGSNDMANLATACRRCNRKKLDRTLKEMGWA